MPQKKIKSLASSNLLEQFWNKKKITASFHKIELLHNQSNRSTTITEIDLRSTSRLVYLR